MGQFLKKCALFLIIGVFIAEIITRMFFITSDIPSRFIDEKGIQKYIPNQTGKWKGGNHGWSINEQGWPGDLPESYNNLITIIGDSFIENFLNPEECHQAVFLKKLVPELNFMEASRSGVSFIEAMEITKELDSLSPQLQLIYIHDSDLEESILQIKKHSDITQLDLTEKQIINGELKSQGIKKILYNWKFLYYLYNRFPPNPPKVNKTQSSETPTTTIDKEKKIWESINLLLEYTASNYNIQNKVLIFRPESNIELINLAKKIGFKTLHLQINENESWSFDYDNHWTCDGHQNAAEQVGEFLKSSFSK